MKNANKTGVFSIFSIQNPPKETAPPGGAACLAPRPLPEDEGEQRPAPPDDMEEEIHEEDWKAPFGGGDSGRKLEEDIWV